MVGEDGHDTSVAAFACLQKNQRGASNQLALRPACARRRKSGATKSAGDTVLDYARGQVR